MNIIVCEDYDKLSEKAALIIMSQITLKPNCILGLATGSTPMGMYEKLVELYKNKKVDFSKVKTFNLDEYEKLPTDNDQSYHYFMNKNLFNHINIKKENINIPNGMAKNIENECENYDKLIKESGGIDIQILGIGKNGHIGFNEPMKHFETETHIVKLEESTRNANSRFFKNLNEVPKKAITMGIGGIFKAKKILLLASGLNKAKAVYEAVHGKITPNMPASILQIHRDVTLILDKDAAKFLKDENYKLI